MGGRCELGRLRQPLLGVRAQAAGLRCQPRRMLRAPGDASWLGRLQDGGDAESTRRTNGDQSPTRSAGSLSMQRELLRGPAQNLGACGRERMTQPDRSTVEIEASPVDDTERGRTSQSTAAKVITFPGRQRAEYLAGERLVDLVVVKVLQRQGIATKQSRYGIGRCHQ